MSCIRYLRFCLFVTSAMLRSVSVKIVSESDISRLHAIDNWVSHTGTDAYIKIVSDGTNVFVLKQISDGLLSSQFMLINDAVASTLGCEAGVPVNEVQFIPYNVGCSIKKYPNQAATLHTFISGTDLEKMIPSFLGSSFTIQQRRINPESLWQKQHPLAEHNQGLVKEVIEYMSRHKDLPLLVAVDTFISNSDRSLPNLFYDKNNNSFCGIDQAAAFREGLAQHACNRIIEYKREGFFCSDNVVVVNGIRLYCQALKALVETEPEIVKEAINKLVPHLCENAFQSEVINEMLQRKSDFFEDNYQNCLLLIKLLDEVT